jgi:replication factor C small subunit
MEENNTIWIEKYRPSRLADIVGQDEIVERLSSYVRTGNLPHLLFTGSAGVGKTTAAVTLAREFFKDTWQTNFREMNASDERGIDVVRNQIKDFARTRPLGDASFKILFLDEADALTTDAQAALRRTMESTPRSVVSSSPATTPRRSSTPSRAGVPSTASSHWGRTRSRKRSGALQPAKV